MRTVTTTTTTTTTAATTTTARAATATISAEVKGHPASPRPRRVRDRGQWLPSSLRARILLWFIAVLVLAVSASILVTYQVLSLRLEQRIDDDLDQEARELQALARADDPATGRPFGARADRVFDVYLERNVPSKNEALITFVDGKPYFRSRQVVPYRLDEDPEFVARVAALSTTLRSSMDTPAGRVEYLAKPLKVSGEGRTLGVFVTATFVEGEEAALESAVRAAALVGLALLLIGSLLASRLADRVVQPMTALAGAARSISETDLSTRIQVSGHDQVAQLASTFNDMLDRLERAFAAQRRFVDDASHELKTPLTIVRGNLELLEDDPDERQRTLAAVADELDRMSRIVDDLLLLAKHEQPDFLHLTTVDLSTLTDELHAKAKALAPRRQWVVDRRGNGRVVADRQRLTQAMIQLAENAARFSKEGDVIALGSSITAGEARLWVRDTGPGIPREEQTAIFARFRRGSSPKRTEGAGLGLAIVKAIAEAHHGRVELVSAPGAGSTFTIVVPVDQPTEAERNRR
jgi:signal transduction histidine kinase